MIKTQTIVRVADNSGAKKALTIRVLGGSNRRYGHLGDIIVVAVKEIGRADGSFLRFDQNSAVLVNPQGEPIGTRIFGPVARELRDRNFMKIVSLAPEVL